MIDYFFGKPRTGKSYRALKLVYDDYINNSEDTPTKYKNVITNVGGFKFDAVNKSFLDRGLSNRAYKLIWKEFYSHLKNLYDMAIEDADDIELNLYATNNLMNDCLIILDEASLYLKKYDDVISWWLSYHGHFKMQIIIIAQSPKQINAEYLSHTEIFYVAQSQTKQLSDSQLRYHHYSDMPFNKDSKFSSNTIKTNPEVYKLYKSGEIDKPKKIIYKFIAILVIGLFASIFAFYMLFTSMGPDSPELTQIKEIPDTKEIMSDKPLNNAGSLIVFRCDSKECTLIPNDKFKSFSLSISYFKYVVITNDLELVYSEVKNEVYELLYTKRGQKKVVLASLIDYSYIISDEVKNKYLSDLFVLNEIKEKNVYKHDIKTTPVSF